MKPKSSLPPALESSTESHLEPGESCSQSHTQFLKNHFYINHTSTGLRLPSGIFPSGFTTKILCVFFMSPMGAA